MTRGPIRRGTTVASWLTLISCPAILEAQNAPQAVDRPVGAVHRIARDRAPAIDGRLDEAVWQDAPVLDGFTQRTPSDGLPATERTEVRILHDDQSIYVAVWAFDSNAAGIIPGDMIRDVDVANSDAVVLIFDTYGDEQNGFVFGTTPAAIEYDGQVANEGEGGGFFLGGGFNRQRRFQAGAGGGFNKNWDGRWFVGATRDDQGWYAEFEIPFNTLRYGEDASWGFNVERRVRQLNEESHWAAVPREFSINRLNVAGRLEGLEPPFRRLASLTPYGLAEAKRNTDVGLSEFEEDFEWGGEAKLQVTRGLTLDATYNTDFAQVEVDDQQVNLTRFSLLFPEKRPFFLENAGFFTVGGGGADLFFSRRIGIENNQPVPIVAGGRLSGRAAGLNVGLLYIATDEDDSFDEPVLRNQFSVARVAKELPSRSRIGGIFVNRDGALNGDYNRTYAVDGQLGIGDPFTFTTWLGATDTPGIDGSEVAFNANAGWSSRAVRASLQYQHFGENFNPEVGFLPRTGHRYYQAFAMYYVRRDTETGIREIRPHVSFFTYRSDKEAVPDNFEETSRVHVDAHFEWANGALVSPAFNWVREGLFEPFTIPGTDVTVAEGTYDGWEAAWRFNSDPSANLAFDGGIDWGDFLSGTRKGGFANLTLRAGSFLSTSVRTVYNNVKLPEGDFDTTLAGLNLTMFFTPRVSLQSLVQYSTQVDRWSSNIRFSWLNTAGTGLFVVFNSVEGIQDLDGNLSRSFIVKYTHQFNVLGG
ncbi:MAG: carbohydrate binding family 9 domain-containing protein [Gemmatimonadota bacterium]|nr:carbohydrate binding family 9 domain-containing protein [Gemmatimonadota bacterium]